MGWVDRQLPESDEIFLDHVGFFVHHIESIATAFERLGFVVTPVNIHYSADTDGKLVRSGTANRLLTFRRGYLEVLAAVTDTPLADQLKARKPGLKVVFTSGYSPDFTGALPNLAQARFLPKPYPPHQLARTVRECLDF